MSNSIPSTKAMEESHVETDSMIWGDMENMTRISVLKTRLAEWGG